MNLRTFSLKTLAVAATLVGAQVAAFAQAQTPSAPAPTSPAKKALIAKVLQLQQPGFENLWRPMLQQPVNGLMQGASQGLRQLPEDKREAAGKSIEAEIKKFIEETGPLLRDRAVKLAPTTVGPILDERFSEEELKQLITWLESPLYKRYLQSGGEMQKALIEKLVAETRPTVEGKLKALEQSIAKQLGMTLPQPATATPPAKK